MQQKEEFNNLLLRFFRMKRILCGLLMLCSLTTSMPVQAATRYETGISTNATLLWLNDVNLNARLRDIKSLGVTWIRVDFSWSKIQPDNPNEYHWDMYDRVVRAAGAHHLKVLAVLDYTPRWARDIQCQVSAGNEDAAKKCSPRSSEEFGRFTRAAVIRYRKQSVRGWEIWNEPNLNTYWKSAQSDGSLFVDPRAYAIIANASATEIRHHSDAAIITGGLSPLFEPTRATGMSQSDYLAQVLPHLKANLFDGVGLHPYTWPILPNKEASYNAFYTVDNGKPNYNLRTIMTAAGWGSKQVWATEYGASTKGMRSVAFPTSQNRPDHVTEEDQAQIVASGITHWYIKQNVGPLFVHSDTDQWLAKHKNEGGFGLRRADGTAKPSYDALKSATAIMKAHASNITHSAK